MREAEDEGGMMSIIETRGLTKDYGGHRGLFDLDLMVTSGRVHGFLGPNGSGKTTTLRLLMGFLKPTRGAARVLGFDPVTHAHEIRARVGYVPGELALPPMLTGREFLDQSAELRGGVDPDQRRTLADQLDADLETKIRRLSKGNRQKIALLDALQHDPPVLILDEPTDGLDPLLRVEVRELLAAHAEAGGTVFLSSHVVNEIQTMCDDVSIVLDGHLRAQETVQGLLAREGLVAEAQVPDPEGAAARLRELGAIDIETGARRIRFRVQGNPLPALAVLEELGAQDPLLRQGDLEEAFLKLYQGGSP